MVEVSLQRADANSLAAEILSRIDAAGLAVTSLLDDPVIGSILRLETEMVVEYVGTALDADDVQPPAECRHAARLAARHGIPLESVIKSYRIGHGVLHDALIETITSQLSSLVGDDLAPALERVRRLFVVMDALIDVVVAEYQLEIQQLADSEDMQLRDIERVLQGTSASASLPSYGLHRTHTAVVATGPIRDRVAKLVNARPGTRIAVDADLDLTWAWFGDLSPNEVASALRRPGSRGTAGVGGPAPGAEGFRQAHHEAALARQVAAVSQESVASYGDSAVAAIGLSSRAESRTLVTQQLGDLTADTPRHREMRRTLEAYTESGHRVRAAATALAVSERTVSNRLAAARRILPKSTALESLEFALALRLHATLADPFQPS